MTNNKKFVWNESYGVKVHVLDEQHKKFFDIANQLSDLLNNPNSSNFKHSLTLTLIELARYALNSLCCEEEFLLKNNCKGYEDHLISHDCYREKVKELLRKARNDETDFYELANEVAEFTQNWIDFHIAYKDKEIIDGMVQDKISDI